MKRAVIDISRQTGKSFYNFEECNRSGILVQQLEKSLHRPFVNVATRLKLEVVRGANPRKICLA